MMDLCKEPFMCAHCGRGIQRNLSVALRHVEVGFGLFEELCVVAYSHTAAGFNVRYKAQTNREQSFEIIKKYSLICESVNLSYNLQRK